MISRSQETSDSEPEPGIPVFLVLLLGTLPLLPLMILAPGFSLLYGWHPSPELAVPYIRNALACLSLFPLALFFCPQAHKLKACVILSLATAVYCLSAPVVLFLLAVSAAWALLFSFVHSLALRIFLFAAGIILLAAFRAEISGALSAMALFWLFGNFSRQASLPHDAHKTWSARSVSMIFLQVAAAPFLVGPRPMGWLSLSYLESKLDFRITQKKARAGLLLNFWGAAILLVGSYCTQHLDFFKVFIWNSQMLSNTEGGALEHLAAGYGFFLLRYFQKAGLTALVAGAWHLSGCSIRYDLNRPFLARNMLDFWARYLNYGREFFIRTVYMPAAISGARFVPLWLAQVIALITVLFMVAIYHYFGPMPIPVPMGSFSAPLQYSFLGCLKHSLWGGIFIGLTFAFSRGVEALLKKMEGMPGYFLAHGLAQLAQIAVTTLALGAFFFSSYSQMLMNYPLSTYLRQILVP